ncbi:MAG: hypothetical protein AB8G18_16245 [Gammaproteobacteria bacterium]
MSEKKSVNSEFTSDFEQVSASEQAWHEERRAAVDRKLDAPRVGLALSGGGIRSATFNLGLLGSLDRRGVMRSVDYLSTVSGGGYVGACYSWLMGQRKKADKAGVFETLVVRERTDVVGWLRAHGKYLVSEPGVSAWTLGASILASTILNLLVFLPVILLVFAGMSTDFMAMVWPAKVYLPGTPAIVGHDGFALALRAGLTCFVLYGLLVLTYALISTMAALRTTVNVLRVRKWMGASLQWGSVLIAIGLIPVVALLDEALIARFETFFAKSILNHISYVGPVFGGMLAIWRSVRVSKTSGKNTGKLASAGLGLLLYGAAMFAYHLVMHTSIVSSATFAMALALALTLGLLCDPNWISMHSYYRARIASAFMPHVTGDSVPAQAHSFDYPLHSLHPATGAPLPIINTTLNTSTSKLYKWRSREGASFSLTPLYCGSELTGYRRSDSYMGSGVALSTAVTVSGAAVDPNNSLVRSRPVSALMSLLNCRLGYWATNPNVAGRRRFGADWFTLVGREVLRVGLSEESRHVHLSDGGQFENLGVYELVKRQCRFIIASDAGADPDCTLSDLACVINKVQSDFSARIEMDTRTMMKQRACGGFCPFAIGTIHYADGSLGELLYVKTMTFEGMPANVYSYAQRNPLFPNESTANQFYGEAQFDAYETLGRNIVEQLLGTQEQADVETLFECAKAILGTHTSVGRIESGAGSKHERRREGSPLRARSLAN